MLKKLFVRCAKILWGCIATSVVLLAVVISVLKYSLPYADEYRLDIEAYLFEQFSAEIHIGGIDASWHRSGPVIILKDVQLAPSPSAPLDISIAETRIEFNFWQSLSQQKMVTSAFLLDGIRSSIDSAVFFKVRPSSEGSELFESLSHLFLSQVQQFRILDSFIVVNYDDGESQNFQLDNLTWVNNGNRHQGQGEIYVDGFSTNSMNVVVDLYGQRRTDIFGQVYFEANNMDVTPWLKQLVGKHIQVKGTDANFSVWGEVKNGLVENILLDVNNSKLNWQKAKQDKYLNVESAQIQWWKSEGNWLLFGNEIQLVTDVNRPSPFNFTVKYGTEKSQLQANKFDLTAVTQLFTLFSATKQFSLLADSNVAGHVGELQMQWGEDLPLSGYLDVVDFDFVPKATAKEAYMGVQNLEFKAYWKDQDIWLDLNGKNGTLLTEDTFSDTITYQKLKLQTLLSWQSGSFVMEMPTVVFQNNEINLDMSLSYSELANSHLSLYAEVTGPTQGKIGKYLPRYLIGDETYDYLQKAIHTGRGELTRVLIDGKIDQVFNSELAISERGKFIVEAKLRDGQFEFDPDWPAIEKMNAKLTVTEDRMDIFAESGLFSSLVIDNNVLASIPLVGERKNVNLSLTPQQLQLSDFHLLVAETPLRDIIGDVFEFVLLDGAADANIKLVIPTDSSPLPNGDIPQVFASGTLDTHKSTLNLPKLYTEFEKIDSVITFANEKFSVEAKSADWHKLPVTFNVSGAQGEDGYHIKSDLVSTWSVDQLNNVFELPVFEHASGEFSSMLNVEVNIDDEAFQYVVDGKSDLTDVALNISGPLEKAAGKYASLDISVSGDQDDSSIVAEIENRLVFTAEIPEGSSRLERAHLAIGGGTGVLPESGFDISIDTPFIEFEPTLNFVLDIIHALPESDPSSIGVIDAPTAINGVISHFNILGQDWKNVSLNATNKATGWLFSIGAQQTLTDITVFNDINKDGILIDSQFLQIVTSGEPTAAQTKTSELISSGLVSPIGQTPNENIGLDKTVQPVEARVSNSITDSAELIRSLPPIRFKCEVCSFNEKPLGKVQLTAKPVDNKLVIETFSFEYERTKLEATGSWLGNEAGGVTSLKGKLYSRYFGKWLQNWGLNSGIKESDATINLALRWDTAPHEFSYEKLNGKADFKLGEGSLSEISDQGARIFSLFSLDSLYRKLKFDFSDVFAKGLFYNDIKGDIVLRNGVALTDNIKMDGVAGDMNMAGQTDLAKNTLDYNVSFKPKVTSSLPAIAAWFAPADGGLTLLAAIALDKIIENAPVVSEIKLKITGDLSDPKVKEVERFTRTVKLPDDVKQKRQTKGAKKKKVNQDDKQPETAEKGDGPW
ncbi:YhdP family protein [Psychrosphaera sp. 1_MG-2023]|uniref:YhdP family protein n=1 Tax=Psychrosphaera sp. 1_MG-2023 TaxID=3062643 RepID=UPI0026E17F5D|nr:YhdP family protein [Psychrosphaera sp. 1_MG-2023]MDO6721186.1 YhdP family protein [Psychrosphaera sp. 1_MG-2023]